MQFQKMIALKSMVFILLPTLFNLVSSAKDPLPTFNVDQDLLTVSGISAGACFATQFHVAYSEIISGVGSWAGVTYLCYAKNAYMCMTMPSYTSMNAILSDTNEFSEKGYIDNTENMQNDKVFIVHGTEDTIVKPESSNQMEDFYKNYVNEENIIMKTDLPATHCIMTDHDGDKITDCGHTNDDIYIENCHYNSVYEMLNYLLGGGLNNPSDPLVSLGELLEFDQNEFFDNDANGASMDNAGFVYVPPSCKDGVIKCRLHIFFHGCSMHEDAVGTDFIVNSDFLQVADANNIIILFPQTVAHPFGGNPYACFNWFGYLNDMLHGDYAKKDAIQMQGIYQMLARAANLS